MQVDSNRFLPRSFRPLYEDPEQAEGEPDPVWADFEPRLAEARITLLTSGGQYVRGDQEPFAASANGKIRIGVIPPTG